MRKTKREKIIKKLIDEEFGPNLSADELCSEIDFTQRKGIKIVQEEKKPFYKKPVFMCLANACLILVCILSSFLITKSNVYRFDNNNVVEILNDDEIDYFNNNNIKYKERIDQLIYVNEFIKIYIFITSSNGEENIYLKLSSNTELNKDILIYYDSSLTKMNHVNDLICIDNLDENSKIDFAIEYNDIKNEYSLQFNK